MKASSWKEAAAAAGVTLVEAGEQTETEEIVQKKKKSLKEMRTGPVKHKESSAKLTESEKMHSILTRPGLRKDMPNTPNKQIF